MTVFLALSSWTYRKLLHLYLDTLRQEFGEEMLSVFIDDLTHAWHDRRCTGVLDVWLRTFCEVASIGLPSQGNNPAVAVPTFAFVLSAAVFGSELSLGIRQAAVAGIQLPATGDVILSTVVGPSVVLAVVSFVATRRPAPCSATSLCSAALSNGS